MRSGTKDVRPEDVDITPDDMARWFPGTRLLFDMLLEVGWLGLWSEKAVAIACTPADDHARHLSAHRQMLAARPPKRLDGKRKR